jgi:uncharacterized damage-inducible protein DinB
MKRITILSVFALVLAAVLITTDGARAQEKPDTNKLMKGGFDEVNGWVTKAAEMVPADKYNYKPTDDVRTFGQLVAHVADSYNYFCAKASGKTIQWSEAVEKGGTDKATLAPKLKQAIDSCNAVYGGTGGNPKELFMNIAHTNLHYGNIITYMRMMGLKPPSS